MDPDAVIDAIETCLSDGDTEEAQRLLCHLVDWVIVAKKRKPRDYDRRIASIRIALRGVDIPHASELSGDPFWHRLEMRAFGDEWRPVFAAGVVPGRRWRIEKTHPETLTDK